MRLRGFVPVADVDPESGEGKEARRTKRSRPARRASVARPPVTPADRALGDDWETRVSLFGEADV
jgi:hypothetical protein